VKEDKSKSLKILYKQKDPSGDFILSREAGASASQKEFVVKGQLLADSQVVEQLISISDIEKKLLRPNISQFTVWINKEKNFSEISQDKTLNQLIIRLKSPDPNNNGVKFFTLPENTQNICFFSQVIECARYEGFIARATKENDSLEINLIWDGYPFFHKLLENFPSKLFSPGILVFGGKNKNGDKRFILKIEGDEVLFELDSKDKLLRRIWISKGITIEKINDKL
jgi:hypothetical protein